MIKQCMIPYSIRTIQWL